MKTSGSTPAASVSRQASACGLFRAVVAVLTLTFAGSGIAYGQAASANATKQKLMELGISKHIKVKEQDGSTVKGTLTAVNDDSFQIIPKDGGAPLAIAYSQVVKVARDGMPKAVKVAIWTVVGVVVAAIITVIVIDATWHF
jgi:hypothetical protein